jgi:hypothetical protein
MKHFSFLLLFLAFSQITLAQYYYQDFDNGTPNDWTDTLSIQIDATSSLWQIGVPQKNFFDEAYSPPRAIMTDTINPYGVSDTAVFYTYVVMDEEFIDYYYGIAAFKWVQKLDIDSLDGGTVDFSFDNGETWENAFTSPYVYNWYGWENNNLDTLSDGTPVFSGTDSTWNEIWLCYEYGWFSTLDDTLKIRFTFFSDSIPGESDGWIIDNLLLEPTIIHTVTERNASNSYVNLYPNPTSERINIELKKRDSFHVIEELRIFSEEGKLMKAYSNIPTKFFIDVSDYPPGIYEVMVRSNLKTETHKVVVTE